MRRTDTTAAKVMYVTKARDQQPSAWVQHEDMKRKQGVQFGGKKQFVQYPNLPNMEGNEKKSKGDGCSSDGDGEGTSTEPSGDTV